MACSNCKADTQTPQDSTTSNDSGLSSPVEFEVYGINTALDATKMFWGYLEDAATADLVKVRSERAGNVVHLHLYPLAADSIKHLGGLTKDKFVFGAYKPNSTFQHVDNTTPGLGAITIFGTLVTIELWTLLTPSRLVEPDTITAARKFFTYQTEFESEVSIFDQLGVSDDNRIAQLVLRYLQAGRTVVLDGRDVIEVYALVKSACTQQVALLLYDLFNEGYVLGKVDAVPGRPGVDTGKVFAVWRLYNPLTAERQTVVQQVDLHSIKVTHVDLATVPGSPAYFVDPDKWSPETCSQCRRACASAFLQCIMAAQGTTGPEAALQYKQCLDDARMCYDKCFC